MKKYIISILFIVISICCNAQTESVEMADMLRSSGKIYVVVGTLLLIFIGIVSYLIYLDKRLDKLENKN